MQKEQDKIITIETGNLIDLMKPGILALIDYSNSRAYLSSAVNITENYLRQIKLINQNQHTVQKEELHLYKAVVLQFVDDPNTLRYVYADYCHKLTVANIKVISRNIKYTIKNIIQPDFRSIGNGYTMNVYLYSQRTPVKLIGVFSNGIEAEKFINSFYPGRKINGSNIIVSDNELTKLYINNYKDTLYNKLMGI